MHDAKERPPLNVLLVEDDAGLRDGLSEYLGLAGCVVTAVGSGLECFAALSSRKTFHVAVVDLGLPDLDGRRLVEHIRQHTDIRIIVLTAGNTPGTPAESYEAGADLYLNKPADSRELAAAIRSLGGRQSITNLTSATKIDWVLCSHDWTLQCPNGKVLTLTAKQLQLLQMLADARGQLISRPAICMHLYERHDQSAEAALSTQIKRLRQRLAESGGDNPIRTAHGGGYAFSAPITLR